MVFKNNSILTSKFLVIDTIPNAVDLLLHNITQELEYSSKKITAIISWILQCYKVDSDFLAPLFAVRTHLATVRYDELNEYKTVLVFYSQYKKNLKYAMQLTMSTYF